MALEKYEDAALTIEGDDKPLIRVSFEFDEDMPDDVRNAFVTGLGRLVMESM